MLSISNILLEYEDTLKITYDEKTMRKIVDKAIRRLETSMDCAIDDTLDNLLIKNGLLSNMLSTLKAKIDACNKNLALYTFESMYHDDFQLKLRDFAYLGYKKDKILLDLKYLQFADYRSKCSLVIEALYEAGDKLLTSYMKRILVVLLMLVKLGDYVGASIIASLLFAGEEL